MKSEEFLRIIGDIDDDLITEAAAKPRLQPRFVRMLGGIAACLVIGMAAVIAVPMLTQASRDAAAPECGVADGDEKYYYTASDGALYDKVLEDVEAYASGTSGNTSSSVPAETVMTTPTASPETEIAQESAADTSLPQPLMGWTFYFYDGKTWRTDTKTYPGGVPAMQTIVNDWLKAAGIKASCTSAAGRVVGEKTEVQGDIVVHTAGVRTWYITLDADITPEQCKALVNTVLESASPSSLYLVEVTTPQGKYAPAQASRIS